LTLFDKSSNLVDFAISVTKFVRIFVTYLVTLSCATYV
jgi:hypothetical protein